jgi:hypothetical protein
MCYLWKMEKYRISNKFDRETTTTWGIKFWEIVCGIRKIWKINIPGISIKPRVKGGYVE